MATQPADVACAMQLSAVPLQKVPAGSCPGPWQLSNCDRESLRRGLDGLNQNDARDHADTGSCLGSDLFNSAAVTIALGLVDQR